MRSEPRPATANRLSSLLLGLALAGGSWGPGLHAAPGKKILSVRRDPDETTHTRFARTHHGIRVWGGEGISHARKAGEEYLVTDPLPGEIEVSPSPSLTRSEALWAVSADLRHQAPFAREPLVELVVLPELERVHRTSGIRVMDGDALNAIDVVERPVGYRLAYHVEAAFSSAQDGTVLAGYMVDAHGGAILRKWNALQTASGTGNSQYSGLVALSTSPGTQPYELRDLDRGANTTLDLAHSWDMAADGSVYGDADNVWGDGQQYVSGASTTSPNGQTAAVDAHYGTQMTWDFYQKVLGRNGIDGKGTPTRARVHYGDTYDNAFWWDACFCLTFGDGSRFKTLTPLDVVGHEFSHGVTATTANLIYMGESGSLNEATSDILGAMVDFYARGAGGQGAIIPDTGGDWTIGEQMKTPAFDRPLRYMYKPSLDGMSPDAWSTSLSGLDVHYGSGPMNRCFYFLSQGAASDSASTTYSSYLPAGMAGLGNDRATRIWYRALTTYLTSSSNYLLARMASLRAAIDLYGPASVEVQAVRNAFAAINVGYTTGTGDDLEPPTVLASASGTTGTIQLSATVHDNVGVARVVFYVDQNRVGSLDASGRTDATLAYDFDSRSIPKGTHVLTASATDAVGNITRSTPVSFQVSNAFYELILQGDFEYGSVYDGGVDKGNMAWVDTQEVITTDGWPYLGRWCADFCGLGYANTRSIRQTVTIPTEAQGAILSFWLQVFSQEPDDRPRDTFQVQVRSTGGDLLATLATYSNLDRSKLAIPAPLKKDYTQHFIDLSDFRGKTIQLWFEGQEDAAHSTPAVPTNLPTVLRPPGSDPSQTWPGGTRGVSFYPSGVGLTEFLLDNVSLRVGEVPDTLPPVATAKEARGTYGVIDLFAEAVDNLAVGRVDYLIDGSVVGSTSAGPHRLSFDSRLIPDGIHRFTVNAYDLAGNLGRSAALAFATDNTFSQLLKNPGFESQLVDWTFTNWGVYWNSDINTTEVNTLAANGAQSGTPQPAVLSQPVSIPANTHSARLSFTYFLWPLSNPPGDALKVQIRDISGTVRETLATLAPSDANTLVGRAELDVLPYRGQDIVVAFAMNTVALTSTGGIQGLQAGLDQTELLVQAAVPPVIFTQPLDQTVMIGARAVFYVAANGPGPLAYQWRKNGALIPGATSSSLILANALVTDAGTYDVMVTNVYGTATSAPALLTVTLPPTPPAITGQPQSQSVVAGSAVSFSVTASGTGLAYQWRKNGVDIGGANAATYTFTPSRTDNGARFSVRVSNGGGSTTSGEATLTVALKPFDLNGDGSIDVLDLAWLMWRHAPGTPVTGSPADLNGDGSVDDTDLALLLAGL